MAKILKALGFALAVGAIGAAWYRFPAPGVVGIPGGALARDVAAPAPGSGSEPIRPLPQEVALDARKVRLGRMLFEDPRLSGDGTIACVSCHNPALGGADGLARSVGLGGAEGEINAPSVLNAGFSFAQYWDGRVATLEEQVDGPLGNPKEMGLSWEQALSRLRADTAYPGAFREAYGDGISQDNVKDAIATFERSLITPNSRLDRFLRGERDALTDEERKGYETFKAYRCVACHQGVNVGGNMFAKIGVFGDYVADRGNPTKADLGRFNVTGRERDRQVFKVPSLRNVALTAPYFHDGSAKTLKEAVVIMAKYQLGRPLAKQDLEAIVAFLKTLTGELEGEPL